MVLKFGQKPFKSCCWKNERENFHSNETLKNRNFTRISLDCPSEIFLGFGIRILLENWFVPNLIYKAH